MKFIITSKDRNLWYQELGKYFFVMLFYLIRLCVNIAMGKEGSYLKVKLFLAVFVMARAVFFLKTKALTNLEKENQKYR